MKDRIMMILLLACLAGCKGIAIQGNRYKVPESAVELGSIGTAESRMVFNRYFETRAFPELEKGIRLHMELLPFDKKMYKVFSEKEGYAALSIQYADSLKVKPQYVVFSLLDIAGYLQELNSPANRKLAEYLNQVKKGLTIGSVALALDPHQLDSLQKADSYYLVKVQSGKHHIALYENGKQTALLDPGTGVVLAYSLSSFCWATDDRGRWYVADLIPKGENCLGDTRNYPEKKEEKNLFKM